MKQRVLIVFASLVLLILSGSTRAQSRPVTTQSLLGEMIDLRHMAEFPSASYTTRQFSSYDRASTGRDDQRTWFANDDRGQFLRSEQRNDGRIERVMMDAKGPGAVVRMWSANPAGTLRIYLDGDETPVLEAPMADVLGGDQAILPRALAGVRGRGYNLYFPIPYAKSCKITSDGEGFYYLVNYRTYATGTPVTSFRLDDLQSLKNDIEKVAAQLNSPRGAGVAPTEVQPCAVELQPGQSASLDELRGPGAITRLLGRVDAEQREAAMRAVVIRMTFDGEQTVEAPLGDFFGSGPGVNPYQSLPLGMTEAGELYCHWFMPYKNSAVIEVQNLGDKPVSISGEVGTVRHEWTERSMHFHAGYRAQYDVPTQPRIDWNYLSARGKGVFAGVAFTIDNPVRQWWGEGDEKIYVDGESFPSWFGTGTEDYFGYAWGAPELFTHAYHNQPRCDGPGTYGRTSLNRFHILDRIPFTESLKFDMELWHWKECKVNLTATTYWYAMPGGSDEYAALEPDDLVVRAIPKYEPYKVAGAIEGEQMEVIARTADVAPQDWDDTSGEQHMWWHNGPKPGDALVLGFAVPKPGRYRVLGRFLKARDYGIQQLAINGAKAGEPIDFYDPNVIVTDEIDLGVFDLKANNEISVTVTGANGRAVKQYMFGLDYLLLKPADGAAATTQAAGGDAAPPTSAPGDLVSARQFHKIYDPSAGEKEKWYINDHCFVLDDKGKWHLFGITHQEPAAPLDEDHLAHATAQVLTQGQWDKLPFALSADLQQWNETHLWAPHVVRHDGTYYMFYCAGDPDHARYKLHLATSPDMKSWTRHSDNPLVVDGYDARDPMVLRVGDEWVMYYTANSRPEGGNHVVKAVTSKDLVRWGDARVVFTAPQKGTFGGPTESPFVVRRGEFYYLFTGAWGGYVGTHVFRSRDPFRWSIDDKVGRIESHALEVVRDKNGAWFVSHCGWGQGGVFLAPLIWNDGLDEAETSMPIPGASDGAKPASREDRR